MKPSQLKQHILALSLDQKRSLFEWLSQVMPSAVRFATITQEEKKALVPLADPPPKPGREVVKKCEVGQAVYQLEQVRCGKEFCKCVNGDLHGPYWYGYQRSCGKLKSWYIGKTLKINDDKDDKGDPEGAS